MMMMMMMMIMMVMMMMMIIIIIIIVRGGRIINVRFILPYIYVSTTLSILVDILDSCSVI